MRVELDWVCENFNVNFILSFLCNLFVLKRPYFIQMLVVFNFLENKYF